MAKPTYLKTLEPLTYRGRRLADVFADFAALAACTLAPRTDQRDACGLRTGTREDEYLSIAKRYSKDELNTFAQAFGDLVTEMEAEPFTDLLGPVYEELQSTLGKRGGGEFYTPAHVSELMAQMILTAADFPHERPLECSEPTCGAGRIILATAKTTVKLGLSPLRLRWTATDVSKTGCDMCFINTSLCQIPCAVVHGNTLSLETWATYPNIWWSHARGASEAEERIERLKSLFTAIPNEDENVKNYHDGEEEPETTPLTLGSGSEQGGLF